MVSFLINFFSVRLFGTLSLTERKKHPSAQMETVF